MPKDSNKHHKTEQTFLWLFAISFLVHVAGCIISVYYIENETKGTNLYSFYRTRVTGERINADPTKNTFIESLNTGYLTTCELKPASIEKLLILRSSYDADLDLQNIVQTWMPATYELFGLPYANGYWMLFVIFFFSSLFQIYFLCQVVCIDYFKRPCLARWLEYAVTSPLQVVLIASCVMIRDVHTIILLFAAQLVCVLLGFPIEYALQNQQFASIILEKMKDQNFAVQIECVCNENECECDIVDTHVKAHELRLLLKCEPTYPVATRLLNNSRVTSRSVWVLCMLASFVLHIFIWFIVIDQLLNVLGESDCYKGPDGWKTPLQTVVYSQCILFTLFAVVPIVQKFMLLKSCDTADAFLKGSIAYAILSAVAKTLLGGSYIAFVVLFPFKTRY
jgi:hypothetical protein